MFDIHGPSLDRRPLLAEKPKLNVDVSYR